MFAEAAEQLRPVDDAGGALLVELVLRAARAGDETALRILTWREHLNALGVEHPEELDERTWDAVYRTHAGGTPRVVPGSSTPVPAA